MSPAAPERAVTEPGSFLNVTAVSGREEPDVKQTNTWQSCRSVDTPIENGGKLTKARFEKVLYKDDYS